MQVEITTVIADHEFNHHTKAVNEKVKELQKNKFYVSLIENSENNGSTTSTIYYELEEPNP